MKMSISLLGSTTPLISPPKAVEGRQHGGRDRRWPTTAGWAALTFLQSMRRGRPRGAGAVLEPTAAGGPGSYKAVARGSG